MTRELDLLLVGATGFTGRLAAAYLFAHAPSSLRWGIAGRDGERLAELARACGGVPTLRLDLFDPASVSPAVANAHVVASTAGPFARLGDPVVDACVEHGTHYVDITGETAWVRRLIDRHHARARAEGTRIVPFCGFDSVPADLGVLRLAREAGEALEDVAAVYRLRGGLNGGTLASALHLAEREDVRELGDPYLLVPGANADDAERRRQADPRRAVRRPRGEGWVAPFFMGAINRRVVMRTHALAAEHPPPGPSGARAPSRELAGYGPRFRYREYQATRGGGRLAATAAVFATEAFQALLHCRPGRALLRAIGPSPGEGPSEAKRSGGKTHASFTATTASGRTLRLDVDAKGDPGNSVTVRTLCEAALLLCEPPEELGLGRPGTGGVLTPALALGEFASQRLEATGEFSMTSSEVS